MDDLRWLEVELDFCFSLSNETSAETSVYIYMCVCGENIRRKLCGIFQDDRKINSSRFLDKLKFFINA